jgi:energy-coupling factor transporter ATP-binding protein EcfA2
MLTPWCHGDYPIRRRAEENVEEIRKEISDWLLAQPDWLQEAAERLLRQGDLGASDLIDLCSMIKTLEGRKTTNHRTFGGLLNTPKIKGEMHISSLGEIGGIENLAPKEPLLLGKGNLVVIYGHNGSGKSGYTRILKKASGKLRALPLKPNVFAATPASQKCRIVYELSGVKKDIEWDAAGSDIGDLRAMDVFDSEEASHYLRNESAASYTPPVVGMFEALAWTCDQVKAMLQNEQVALASALPAPPPAFSLAEPIQRYRTLRPETTEADVESLLKWTEEDAKKLADITERLKVADPAALAKQKRATKGQTDQLVEMLKTSAEAYGEKNLAVVRNLCTISASKRRIATEAAQVSSSKLDGVGGETWHRMWEAAREYSKVAYPAVPFPVTEGARCVLCHQEIGQEAGSRLRDFESFVQGKLEAEARVAESQYAQALKSLPDIPSAAQIETVCEAAGLGTDEWKNYLSSVWTKAAHSRAAIMAGETQGAVPPFPDVSETLQNLLAYSGQLESQAVQSDKDAAGFDRAAAAKQKTSLEAKQWISLQAIAVRNEVVRLRRIKEFEEWKSLANSRPVSTKAGAISEKVITQAYVRRFNDELRLLGAGRIKVELVKTKTEKGKVLHRLQLRAAQQRQPIELVLSEGERRIISLAAFLADVTEKPYSAPFVFDDPISSLDHDFEWSVACRLAELAKERQVLVFTHRLSLYGAMDDAAKKQGDEWKKKHLSQLCIESYSGTSGHPVAQAAWNSKTTTANNILLDRLVAAKKAGDAGGGDTYRALAQGICSDFRKLLERTVEDDLLNEVVKRHRRSVTTDNRIGALHLIRPEDCQMIDDLMTKYSCYEHSQSYESPAFIPEEPELRADIESLRDWRKEFFDRRKGG